MVMSRLMLMQQAEPTTGEDLLPIVVDTLQVKLVGAVVLLAGELKNLELKTFIL